MSILAVTTIMRKEVSVGGEYGFLYIVNTNSNKLIEKKIKVGCSDEKDYRGHSFGVRGICNIEDNWFVADSSNVIHVFDNTFSLVDSFIITGVLGIHQIVVHNGLIYVCSCGNDKLYVLNKAKTIEVINLNRYSNIIDNLGLFFDKEWGFGRLHFNSVCFEGNDEIDLYCSGGVVFNRTKEKVIYSGGRLNSPHDLLPFDGGFFINNSNQCETVFLNEGKLNTVFKSNILIKYTGYNKPGYTRGLCRDNDSLFIGASPVILSEIDINTYEYKNSFLLSENKEEVIYDVCLVN